MTKVFFLIFLIYGLASKPASAAVTYRSASSAVATVVAGGTGIVHEGAGNESTRTSCGTISPSIPTSTSTTPANDILIATVVARENNATVTAPAGWNQYFSDIYPGEDFQSFIFWRYVGTTSPSTVFTQSGSCDAFIAQISRFSGVHTSMPFDPNVDPIANTQWVRQNTGDLDTGSVTTTSPTAMLIVAGFVADNRRVTEGAGWSPSFDTSWNTTRDNAISLFYQLQTTIGSKSISDWDLQSNGNDPNYGVIFALRPASGVGTPTLTITMPTGTISGDLMLASISTRPNTVTVTAPIGWTLRRSTPQTAGNTSVLNTYYKTAGASEPSSYNWTFSAANFNSAVGGIASFTGVDAVTPIDADAGSATASSTSHTAPSVSTTLPDGMLITIHEYTSSRSWSPPVGMSEIVDVSSLTPNDALGISLEMNYEVRPAAGATGTRTATISGDADTGATQSFSLKPIPPLVCFTDDFNRANGSPGSNWVVSNNSGSFGNPVIFNNRLRLTDASGNVATMATLQQIFPGAGNRIEVEFDHYADFGSGADGIAVILSDYSVSPVPGGYGGSLGYAQRTGINGFAGGWIGVGIDEYGNFSNPTEGRIGGPGFRRDSIAIRGSGSGITGYEYHAGTAANLVPEVDNNGAASPAHRYRIIIDHSNGVNAWVSVDRDVGAGYVALVAPYDAKAQAGQSAVPTNWILSYTGSTGGATNVHEIDSLSICATAQSSVSGPDHFAINYASGASGTGVNCQAEGITIEAHDNLHNINTTYTGTVTLSNSTSNGDWSKTGTATDALGTLTPGAGDSGAASYTFVAADNGSVILNFKDTHTEVTNLNAVDGAISETSNSAVANDDYQITFASTGFDFLTDGTTNDISTQIGGKPSNVAPNNQVLELQAIKTGPTGACESALQSNQTIEIAFECINPTACTGNKLEISINDGANYTAVTANSNGASPLTYQTVNNFDFGDATDTTAPFVIRYNDVGNIKLHARKILTPSTEEMLGSSNGFVVRPFAFYTTVTGNPAATSPAGAAFTSAGTDFTVNSRAVLWQSADDDGSAGVGIANDGIADGHESTDTNPANNVNLADNTVANNYGQETTVEQVLLSSLLNQPSGGTDPGLDDSSANGRRITSFTLGTGIGTSTTINYDEVGIIELYTNVNDGDYLGIGGAETAKLLGRSGFVGRFRPHHFDTIITDGCSNIAPLTSFTYSGQPISVQSIAMNNSATPSITQNYAGGFAKDVTLSSTTGIAGSFNGTENISDTDFVNGSYIKTDVAYTFTTKESGPDATFLIRATDTEGMTSNDPTANEGTTDLRSGRARLENVFGSELTPLIMPLNFEYYSDNATPADLTDDGFILNTDDSCATYDATLGTLANFTGNLALADVAVTGTGTAAQGIGNIIIHQPGDITLGPGPGNEGTVNLLLNTSIPTDLGYPATNPYWLTYNWGIDCDGDTVNDTAPCGIASFGLYRGDDRIIYWREVFQ